MRHVKDVLIDDGSMSFLYPKWHNTQITKNFYERWKPIRNQLI